MVTPTMTPTSLEALVTTLPHLTPNDRAIIERAYHKAERAHAGQFRKSGEPYFTHCVAVAAILADLRLDAEAIAAALMHDTLEDTSVTYEEIVEEFGATIARLIDGVTKLKNIPINLDKDAGKRSSVVNKEVEYIRKMFMTMGHDIRVVLIKLADRLHNMRTLGYMKPEKQLVIARETQEIFAPLANRLGIWQIKWELEDLSLRYLDPDTYRSIAAKVDERRASRERYMADLVSILKTELGKNGLDNATISGRPKHITSIYNKMMRKNLPFDQIYDVRALRVIVDTIPQCYQALGIVHNLWQPIPREFDDYIARPKDNLYQSLHTAVYDKNGKTVEVQIRTWEMHHHAEYGIAAHWRYKEGGNSSDPEFERRLNVLRQMMEFGDEVNQNAEQFVDAMKTEFFQDRVYVVTPKGDIVDLPAGSTPVDFAYHIHTDIGHRTRGAKINGRLVNLSYQLKSGEQVEIMTAKRGGPSMDWLNPDNGYVKTNRAQEKIRHYFRKLNRDQHIQLGRESVERELRKIGLAETFSHKELAELFNIDNVEDFLASVGAGDINGAQLSNRALEADRSRTRAMQAETELLRPKKMNPSMLMENAAVQITGTSNMLSRLATCCNPVPGDDIVGYVTRGRGVTIHRRDCPNVENMKDRERLLDVGWGNAAEDQKFIITLDVVAYDRDGLLRDISTVIADERINIYGVNVDIRGDVAVIHLKLQLSSPRQLTRIISRVSMIPSVSDVYRPNAG